MKREYFRDADPQGEYAGALSWALTNRKTADIKNIALTGPYGSGKSSILKTFQSHNTNPDLCFLNISLATFKEETENQDSAKGSELLRLIELSILQQIFYHEEDHKIPDSRFKKIKSFKRKHLWLMSAGVFILAIATIHLFNKDFFENLLGYTAGSLIKTISNLASASIVLIGYFYIIFKSIRTISGITINKLNIQDAEIAISDSISKSILNNHLDEILYFFEVTKYTVVVIEDLDRFEQTEIFTKLRELNQLINYTEKIKREIVFIYAVRDDIFKDKDRTKFFDFIIPVIPVINSSNSIEKLREIVIKNNYKIDPALIENISLFIDDMRLLYNITNEYFIYHRKLGNLNPNKLLAMMVYKNIYPNDFVDLSNGDGKLFNVFNKKDEFVKEKLEEIDDQLQILRTKVEELDAMLIVDVQELRRIYIYKYIEKLSNISSFIMNGTSYNFSEVTSDENFQHLVKNKFNYNTFIHNYNGNYYQTNNPVSIKFTDIEAEVDSKRTYANRVKMINDWGAEKTEELKSKMTELENQKVKIRHYKIKDIIALGGCKMDLENKKQLQLVNILLRNSYIDEDYLDYISIFYEGSITKEDREFLLNVKAQIKSEFDYKLNKINKLIPKIDSIDFAQNYILNYNLVDELLCNANYKNQETAVFNILKDESETSISFINGFIDSGKNVNIFINMITKVWPNIWQFVSQRSNFTRERLQVYLRLVLEYSEIDDIKSIASRSKLKSEISSMEDFLNIAVNSDKLKQIINTLQIKFVQLNFAKAPVDLAKFVYEHQHYLLTDPTIRVVIKQYGRYEENDFNTRNFYAITESGCEPLKSYIRQAMDDYITNVYLPLEDNVAEDEAALLVLLNEDKLSSDKKKEIVEKVSTKVIDIKNVKNTEIVQYLLEASRLVPTWQNLIHYYHEADDVFDDYIIEFINFEANAQALSAMKINIENPVPDLATVNKFIRSLILEENISNTCYEVILKSVPYYYDSLSFGELSKEKVAVLIQKQKLGLSVDNYDLLRSDFNGLHLVLAEQKHQAFIEKIADYVIEEPEVFSLLSSTVLNYQEKSSLISHVGEPLIIGSPRITRVVGTLAIASDQLVISKNTIIHILLASLSTEQKIQLLVKKIELMTKEEVSSALRALPVPYSEIAILGKRPMLSAVQINWDLANKLVNYGHIKRAVEEKGKIRISTFRSSAN
ncbi:YobI family P-loop NTPase [Dyadobacter crusticola]|uniref:YobI family P-loop NTPase n=1 Tax=Dyadobacter crusticola TaxID=292407 RepID=UPI0004E1BFAB|nr:P-loop NTPase fold protein [Dyadobacter crusticola]